jgi:hypothetical protein
MTLVDDRRPVASGTTSPTDPPPVLPNVDEARRFYVAGRYVPHVSSFHPATPGTVYYVETGFGGLGERLDLVAAELTQMLQLRPGWDGRHAGPVTQAAVYTAGLVLLRLLAESQEVPQLFPLPSGGLQAEWYADDELGIEIEIDAAGEAYLLATAADGEVLAEGTLDAQAPSELASTAARLLGEFSGNVAARRRTL